MKKSGAGYLVSGAGCQPEVLFVSEASQKRLAGHSPLPYI